MTYSSFHQQTFDLPKVPLAAHGTTGAVIVHGFTSDQRAVEPLRQLAHELGFVTEAPLLRGHGGHHRELRGVCWSDWMTDLAEARARLHKHTQRVVLIGFSMGGLLSFASAAQQAADVAAIVALAPALRIAHPLAPVARMARGWLPFIPMGKSSGYGDQVTARRTEGYKWCAVDSFCSFYEQTHRVERVLPQIKAPVLLIHSRQDRVIRPESARIAYDGVSSADKQLIWFERSGHRLLDGADGPAVLDCVRHFLHTRFGHA